MANAKKRDSSVASLPQNDRYTCCQKFFLTPLTLTLSPRWGERGQEERTFGKRYKGTFAAVIPWYYIEIWPVLYHPMPGSLH